MKIYICAVAIFLAAANSIGQSIAPSETSKNVPAFYTSVTGGYYNQTDGMSLTEIVKRAFDSHGDIIVARLEVDKARARLRQAELRPNPSIEFEQSTGRLVGSPGDRETSVGLTVPLEIYGQRIRRIAVARAEITLREAELVSRQRELTSQVFAAYVEALTSLREIQVLEELLDLDERTVRFVQIRVNEGETPPLELGLLQTEVDRLRSRRQLNEGRLGAAFSRLKFFAGIAEAEPLKLREEITVASLPLLPPNLQTGIALGLKNRPEIRIASLEEELATAGLRLIRAQARPDISATARYTQGRSGFDDPRGEFFQSDRSLTFGISIGLPIFNRNQGAKAEAEIAIRQARERRTFAERIIRNEITTAFQRIEAARRAALTLETSVLPRSRENIETIRKVYEIGELKITDLIAEQRKLLEANRDYTETLTERYRAQADLFIALGITLD
jgi:cobalt-zinc-cadmium efflux system outer membrane protein